MEVEDVFADTAPMLFGKSFDQRAKDHMEAIRSLKKTSLPATGSWSFQRGHPPMSRGGGTFRSRAGTQEVQDPSVREKNSVTVLIFCVQNLINVSKSIKCISAGTKDMVQSSHQPPAINIQTKAKVQKKPKFKSWQPTEQNMMSISSMCTTR